MNTDILWHNAETNETQIWFMDQHQRIGRGTVVSGEPGDPELGNPALVGLPFSIVGCGDFDGNGNADILWHNAESNEAQIWFMDHQQRVGRGTVVAGEPGDPELGNPALVGLPFSIVGCGDFDGNGKADILWHNEVTNETQIWFMDHQQRVGRGTVISGEPGDPNLGNPALAGFPFSIVGCGDFNGNGCADILWHNAVTNETQIWFMDHQQVTGRGTVVSGEPGDPNLGNPILVGLPFSIVGCGDFDGNGKADILWHNAVTNESQIWLMDNEKVIGRRTVVLGEPGDAELGKPALVGLPFSIVGAGPFNPLTVASTEISEFHASTLGILVVGSPVGSTHEVGNGVFEQRYDFGSIVKPLNGPPTYATRFIATIDIAAIKCFGTDDPSGTDEPYIVVAAYGIDPLVREAAVQTTQIHFGSVDEKAIFAQGRRLTPDPILIPGDGNIQLNISLWDEEVARPSALQDKWQDVATAAILGGLTLLNPGVGAAAAALETAKGVVSDASRELITTVSDFLGLSDDHLGTHEFSINADFLKRLIADGSGLPRNSGSIPGIRYNFPELPETPDATGHSWLFEGGGGSYRIFLTVRAAEITLSPSL